MTYMIQPGNWTSAVTSNLGTEQSSYLYPIGFNAGSPDPAPLCAKKTFYASYKCGNDTVAKNISAITDAVGKQAKFDCTDLFNICNGTTLHLGDDGILRMYYNSQREQVWDSTQAPTNATPLTNNQTLSLNAFKPENNPTARLRNRTYLKSGEFLERGEYISSPNGKCRLEMKSTIADPPAVGSIGGPWIRNNSESLSVRAAKYLNDGTTIVYMVLDAGETVKMITNTGVCKYFSGRSTSLFDPSQWNTYTSAPNNSYIYFPPTTETRSKIYTLQVVYNSSGCSDIDPINSKSSKLYSIPWTSREHLGNMGYVNEHGQLETYDNTITTSGYSATFDKLQNADGSTYGMYGGNLANGLFQNIPDVENCRAKCETYGTTDGSATPEGGIKCVGFEYEKIGKTCQLKGDGVITGGIRYNNPQDGSKNYEYYSRLKSVSDLDTSCTTAVFSGSTTDWKGFTLGEPMSSTSKCGLANAVSSQRNEVSITDASLNSMNGLLTNTINSLYAKYQDLKDSLLDNKTKLETKFNELNDSKKDLADWSGEQSEQLDAMNEDRDLNMISQNYKHIMWSILAILVIIGIIKFTKSFGGSQAVSVAKSVDIPKIPSATTAATAASATTAAT